MGGEFTYPKTVLVLTHSHIDAYVSLLIFAGWLVAGRSTQTQPFRLVAAIVSRLKSPSPARKASAIKACELGERPGATLEAMGSKMCGRMLVSFLFFCCVCFVVHVCKHSTYIYIYMDSSGGPPHSYIFLCV